MRPAADRDRGCEARVAPRAASRSCERRRTTNESLETNAHVLLLDGHVDQRAVLGPRTVVVLHVRVLEQVLQREPRVRRALANAAVRDHAFALRDALPPLRL